MRNHFLKGILLLGAAAFLGECVEFFINMILAKELGEQGMGMYMTILPLIMLVVVIANLELPVSISKFVAEKNSSYHYSMLKAAMKFSFLFTCIFLTVVFAALPFLSVFEGYHPAVKWLCAAVVPIVAASSIARGYFMGVQEMGKIAVSGFLRKAFQLLFLFLIFKGMTFDLNTSLLVALCAMIGSELLVCFYLIFHYLLQYRQLREGDKVFLSGKEVRKNLLSVSLPTTGLRIFHSITNAIEPFLVKSALIASGMTGILATEQFGMMAGVAMTIGFFPAFIAHSLMVALIPNVSEAYSKRNFATLQKLLQQAMWITFLYGVPSVFMMYQLAEPLTSLFFHSSEAAWYLKLLWPYFLFHFFVIPMQAYLIGLGLVKDAFIHTVWSHTISFSMMFWLGSLSTLQMEGIILGMNMGAVLLTLLHYAAICKKIGFTMFLGRNQSPAQLRP
ncbi:oligosaccharide flippase family protein [Bacillus lacus]|uniref:Oligosaccharide flippase family protein n=1 Tax=Metabacillus lacus TaxID=1983721 RepID=A0A7X2LYX2_9BACI|nr:polysaccharide biosynthesis protein [Metabacillus lacus]MRX72278.1 oligosaccharide flippase family protein [Metabacillus lacus]